MNLRSMFLRGNHSGWAVGLLITAFLTLASSVLLDGSPADEVKLPKANLEVEAAAVVAEHPQVETLAREFVAQRLDLQASQLQLARFIHIAAIRDQAWVPEDAVWPTNVIPVSWENPTAGNLTERQWIRGAVERTWVKESAVRFTGWNSASADSKGIRIRISDEGPHCKHLGIFLNGVRDGMELNIDFRVWCHNECTQDRRGSIEQIAVHEFGHALAFAHEQNRPDAPEWCQKERQGSDGDKKITVYDPDSVMNYCSVKWNNGGKLSERDVQAVRFLYGQPAGPPAPATTPSPPPTVVPLAPASPSPP
jgi:Astacin (Peptidase family M12A)